MKYTFHLVKRKINLGYLKVQYDPTGTIWCGILAKPKQEVVFRKFRGHLMNILKDYYNDVEHLATKPSLLLKNTSE